MNPIAPATPSRRFDRRASILLASCATRLGIALAAVAAIWLCTAWALGWF
ncbi:MAG TPA: hypothetical protein VKZ70_10960 [Burkholderiaceae bacterium]|nr:hypothetical protein [Burkholderiaceae bacterium]